MQSKKIGIAMLVAVALLLVSVLTMAMARTGEEPDQKATAGVIQYRLVPITSPMTQQQFQTVLTAQGNAGWRLLGPYAVGSGPIPTQEVLLFSKP
jgi:hypothetical protein